MPNSAFRPPQSIQAPQLQTSASRGAVIPHLQAPDLMALLRARAAQGQNESPMDQLAGMDPTALRELAQGLRGLSGAASIYDMPIGPMPFTGAPTGGGPFIGPDGRLIGGRV